MGEKKNRMGTQSLLGSVWKQNLHWRQGLSPQLGGVMTSCKQDTVPETGLAVMSSTIRKIRLVSVPRKDGCSRLWLPLLLGYKFLNSSASRVQTAFGFPWITWKLFTAATGSCPLHGQWTNYSMPQILRLPGEAYCIFASHFIPCWSTMCF